MWCYLPNDAALVVFMVLPTPLLAPTQESWISITSWEMVHVHSGRGWRQKKQQRCTMYAHLSRRVILSAAGWSLRGWKIKAPNTVSLIPSWNTSIGSGIYDLLKIWLLKGMRKAAYCRRTPSLSEDNGSMTTPNKGDEKAGCNVRQLCLWIALLTIFQVKKPIGICALHSFSLSNAGQLKGKTFNHGCYYRQQCAIAWSTGSRVLKI